jgi:hypothetical protein
MMRESSLRERSSSEVSSTEIMFRVAVFGAVVLGGTLSGCSSGALIERVEGIVTLDGQPLPDIRVNFQPQSRETAQAGIGSYGVTDAQGRYVLRRADTDGQGAVVGTHTVSLSDKKVENASDADAGDTSSVPKSRIPAKYAETPLTYEVKAGEMNEANFELTSQ